MSEVYPHVPLGDVLTHYTEYIDAPEPREYPKLSVRLYGRGVVMDAPTDGANLKMKRHQIARAGQVILSEIWGKKGAIGFVPREGTGALCTSHFFLFDVREDRVDPRWLQAIFTANYLQDQLDTEAKGTTGYAAVRPKHLLATTIPLPPLDEQRRIVARIEALAAKIEEARGLRREAEAEAAAFIASLHLSSASGRNRRIDEFLVLDEDRVPVVPGSEYPQVGVRGFGKGLFARGSLSAADTTYKHFNRLNQGAVVLSQVKGWEGAIAVCPPALEGRFASPEYRTFRCIEGEAIPGYLAAVFTTPWFLSKLTALSKGVGARRERTRPEHFLKIEMPMPSIAKQLRAVESFRMVEHMTQIQMGSAAELDALLPAILDRAFRGEL